MLCSHKIDFVTLSAVQLCYEVGKMSVLGSHNTDDVTYRLLPNHHSDSIK